MELQAPWGGEEGWNALYSQNKLQEVKVNSYFFCQVDVQDNNASIKNK